MVAAGRVPEYAVRNQRALPELRHRLRYSTDPAIDPIHAFVHKHYSLQAQFPPFEVWKLN
jgi:hypothetical protein